MANKYQQIMEGLGGLNFPPAAKPTNLEQLEDIEARLGRSLPPDYHEFLLDYGGCSLNFAAVSPVEEEYNDEESIWIFYGDSSRDSDIAESHRLALKNASHTDAHYYSGLSRVRDMEGVTAIGWPDELLAIGCDEGGNQICLALSGLRPNAIFFWSNSPDNDAQNVYLIADSFDEFMHLLKRAEF